MRTYLLPVAILILLGRVAVADVPEAATSDAGTPVVPLDGTWSTAQDFDNVGLAKKWFDATSFPTSAAKPLQVPGALTEIWRWKGEAARNIAWYSRTFTVPATLQPHRRYYLRFGGVMDDVCDVWINGTHLGQHAGNQEPFEYEVTSLLQPGKPNTVAVRMPLWMAAPMPIGGVIDHVAIVEQPDVRLIDAFAKPAAKAKSFALDVTIENNTTAVVPVDVSAALSEFKSGHAVNTQKQTVTAAPGTTTAHLTFPVAHPHVWDLNDPFLYKVAVATSAKSTDGGALKDAESFRTGFRDFRMVNGYFTLNGRRIFLKSLHGNWGDPLTIVGTPRDMTYLKKDFPQLKAAGFNTMRFIVSPAYPEQLEQADELGFLIYSEHPTAWLLHDPKRFGESLNQVVRRDRNHPSLVLWGLLNETSDQDIYHRAKNWLPQVRAIDDTRTVILSSGRWDGDFKTGSISNPGSATWDTYLGGQDPQTPRVQDFLKSMGNFGNVSGDDHMYPMFPLTWDFITKFAKVDEGSPHTFFYSESGMGSLEDGIEVKRLLQKSNANPACATWDWANAGADGIVKTWTTYGFNATYPNPQDAFIDSELISARQRAMIFSMTRSNPLVMGYNLTSLVDCWGSAEGIVNDFREWKPGHLRTMQEGWAPLRWCLFVNPMNAYADAPLHIKATLANEDVLAPGDYPATLEVTSPGGVVSVVWKQAAKAHFEKDGPFANILFDSDVTIPNLKAGAYSLRASLDGKKNAAAATFDFVVSDRAALPKLSGTVTALDVPQNVRDLLTKQGAQVHDYAADAQVDREVILIGRDFKGKAADWRALYAKAARGAHLVFLDSHVFRTDKERNKWLALAAKGGQRDGPDWLYHKEIVAKANDPLFAGLPTKMMDPDFYGEMLANAPFFFDMTNPAPQDTAAVALFNDYGGPHYRDGVVLASYPFHAGRFTLNTLSLLATVGAPSTDRLLLNFVTAAQKDAAPLAPLPADYDAEMDKFGFKD